MSIPTIENYADFLCNSLKTALRAHDFVPQKMKYSRANWVLDWWYMNAHFKLWVVSEGCHTADLKQGSGEDKPIKAIKMGASADFGVGTPQLEKVYPHPKITEIAHPKCQTDNLIDLILKDYAEIAVKFVYWRSCSRNVINELKNKNAEKVSELAEILRASYTGDYKNCKYGQLVSMRCD